jgi:hypothetical protein
MMLDHAYPHPQLPPHVTATQVFLEEAEKISPVWTQAERNGQAMRAAHRMIEWDGWEEGLADAILGEEEDPAALATDGERTERAPPYAAVIPVSAGGMALVQSQSPRGGIGPKGGGVNGHIRKVSTGGAAAVNIALLNGLEEGLRRNGLLSDN